MSSKQKIYGNLKSDSYRGKPYRFMTTTNDGQLVPLNIGVNTLPTASADYRGQILVLKGESDSADIIYICVKKDDNTYAWGELPYSIL